MVRFGPILAALLLLAGPAGAAESEPVRSERAVATLVSDTDRVQVSFPPAFVHTGSAVVRVSASAGKSITYPPDTEDGYLAEWRTLADVLDGTSVVEYDELLDDARYALTLADAAADLIAGAP